jgi:hypothetical protein
VQHREREPDRREAVAEAGDDPVREQEPELPAPQRPEADVDDPFQSA